jgi:hypothetical protein
VTCSEVLPWFASHAASQTWDKEALGNLAKDRPRIRGKTPKQLN